MLMSNPGDTTAHPTTHRLNGAWQAQSVPLDSAGLPEPTGESPVIMPECAHLQPVLYPDQPYWGEHIRDINRHAWVYRKTFTVPDVPFSRARLRFEAVDYFAAVWVNGQRVGEHEGHFAPFTFDITPYLRRDAPNELAVRVSAPWDEPNPGGTYPINHVIRGLVKGLYEHGEGVIPPDVNPLGIWRPVWLLLDDGVSVDHARIHTSLNGEVAVRLTVTNATGETWRGAVGLQAEAENHDGAGVTSAQPLQLPPGTHDLDYTVAIPDPRLWWPWDQGDPNLYRLTINLQGDDGRHAAQHDAVFGIRTIRLHRSPHRFTYYVNERPVFIRGSSYMPGLYLSEWDAERLGRDVTLTREANLNLLRVHVHVAPPELYDLCNRAGILIFQDFELNWTQSDSPEFEARAMKMQRDMIDLLGNHPAVMSWACHNEPTMVYTNRRNLEAHPDPALYADACAYDPTRPVFICSGQIPDDWQRAGDIHTYYGAIWSARYTDIYRHTFRLNTEFGFEAPAAANTLRQYPEVWERMAHLKDQIPALWQYQSELVGYQVEHVRRLRDSGCGGYIHFWLTDLVPQVGCGVLDSARQPKGGYAALRRASAPLHVMLEYNRRRPVALWGLNDTPQDYPAAQLAWQVWGSDGKVLTEGVQPVALRANRAQRLTAAHWKIPSQRIEWVVLSLVDTATGHTLAENRYEHPFRPALRPRGYPWKFDPFLGTKVFDRPDAPSLADHNINRVFRLVPLAMRQAIAEWALRQRFPRRLLSLIAAIADSLL
jgi:beta-mannosidase